MQKSRQGWNLASMPMLIPAFSVAAGIGVITLGLQLWRALLLILVLSGIALWLKRPRIVMAAGFSLVGALMMWLSLPVAVPLGQRMNVSAEVLDVREAGDMQRCVVETDDGGRLLVNVNDFPRQIVVGDKVTFDAVLRPAVRRETVPDEYNSRRQALVWSLSARCNAESETFRIIAPAAGVRGRLNTLRQRLKDSIIYSGMSQDSSDFLVAVILGENNLSQEQRALFSHAGLAHVMALSGTHLSTIALMLALLLLPVELCGGKRWKALLLIPLLWGYAILTGMSPSVVRAVVMATFLLTGRAFGRPVNSMNLLFASVAFILLLSPTTLFRESFQLSVLAVAGILMITSPLKETLSTTRAWRRRAVRWTCGLFILPIAATMATAPLAAYYFHFFPVLFLISNIPVGILLPFYLAGGVIVALFGLAGISLPWLTVAMQWCYDAMCMLASFLHTLPFSGLGENISFPGMLLLPLYAALFMLWLGWVQRRKLYLLSGVLFLLMTVALTPALREDYPRQECFPYHESNSVALLVRQGSNVTIYTDASVKHFGEIRERAASRLGNYLLKRNATLLEVHPLDSINILEDNRASGESALPRVLVIRKLRDIPVRLPVTDLLIVSAGFNGSPSTLVAILSSFYSGSSVSDRSDSPESSARACHAAPAVILSPTLPRVLRKELADTLSAASIPFSLKIN